MNYLEYTKHREEKEAYWKSHALKVLADPRATQSEVKCAIIGVQSFDDNLTQQLKNKKWHKLKPQ